jgi:hypothetical protein
MRFGASCGRRFGFAPELRDCVAMAELASLQRLLVVPDVVREVD